MLVEVILARDELTRCDEVADLPLLLEAQRCDLLGDEMFG